MGSIIDEKNEEVESEITAIGTDILMDWKKKTQCRATTIPISKSSTTFLLLMLKISFRKERKIKSDINENSIL